MNKNTTNWIDEYHKGSRYGLEGQILIDKRSRFQRITIIDSKRYGKALLLNGCWMTAERQEKTYHECLAHPALCSAGDLKRVLIIGGGDGGTARECLRHSALEYLDLVEIDEVVVETSQKYLPTLGGSIWNDQRMNLAIEDGVSWVSKAKNDYYDVVIVDGSDPVGPAKGLFNKEFFENCRRILKTNGVFATQSESPESFHEVHVETVNLLKNIFEYAQPLYGWVPIYPSGWWSWTFGAIDSPRFHNPINSRIQDIASKCEIWSPRWQKGAFEAIPACIERELEK